MDARWLRRQEAGSRKPGAGSRKEPRFELLRLVADYNRLLLFTDTRKVWRSNTRGDYWVLDRGNRRGGRSAATRTRFLRR